MKFRAYSAVFVSIALLTASAASAQSTKERLRLLEQRMDRVERSVNNNDSETDMLRRLQALQSENETLRNEVETLQFETVRSADRQRQLYIDLDARMQAIEAGGAAVGAAGAVAGGAAVAGVPASGSDQKDYQAAFDLLKQARYADAAAAFSQFLAMYASSDLRDNAQYWLAETHYVDQNFATALDGFKKVVADYPASRKIPDAWLKIGFCNYELKQWPDAKQALVIVQSRFPESTAARLATQRLEKMKAEGH